jgi:hypothetical protein
MDNLLNGLFIFLILWLIIGLINPKWALLWSVNKTRRRVLLYFGLLFIIFLSIYIIISPSQTSNSKIDDLFALLFLLSTIWLVIGIINPSKAIKFGNKKTRLRVILYYFIFFVILVSISSLINPPTNTNNSSTPNSSTSQQISQISTTKSKQNIEQNNVTEKEESSQIELNTTNSEITQEETEITQEEKGIPGLLPADIYINLENAFGLKVNLIQGKTGNYFYYGEKSMKNGISLICQIYLTNNSLLIDFADFIVDVSGGIGIISKSTINEIVKEYLGYCATVPYDGANPLAAKNWVIQNIKNIKSGKTLTKVIGKVKFELFGNDYIKTLRIKALE